MSEVLGDPCLMKELSERAVELFEKALEGFSKPEVPPALERSVGAGH